ncbi:MAG: response regulator [Pseudomonadota bacterium]
MNLDIGILWIEDSFNPQEEVDLKRRVQDAGFLARINTIPNSAGIEDLSRRHQLYHLYDLILLDYRLQDENGDELAPRIRELFPSTTILFYSGSAQVNDLRRMIAEKEVEGVYCSIRDRFIERAGALIDQTARSLDRLSGMRGLAMRVVAECDDHMRAAILSMSARDVNCAGKSVDLDDAVFKDMDGLRKSYQEATDISARIESRAVDSAKLFGHFRRLTKVVASDPGKFGLDADRLERLRELRNVSSQYDERVLRKRNILGHVKEVPTDAGWELQGAEGIAVCDFPDIRQAFATHIDAFREMRDLVTYLDGQQTG